MFSLILRTEATLLWDVPRAGLCWGYGQHHSEIQMVGTTAVKAFVWEKKKKKKDEKINLLVRYFFNDTVYVDSLDPDPANASPPARLNVGP